MLEGSISPDRTARSENPPSGGEGFRKAAHPYEDALRGSAGTDACVDHFVHLL